MRQCVALSFLHIGKANTRIKELETQVATLIKERDDALAAVESNAGEVGKTAEELQTNLSAAQTQVTKLTSDNAALTATASTQAAEIKSLTDKLAAQPAEVKIQVARQVAQTQAALGQPPIPAVPAEATGAAAKSSKTGMARVMDSARADLEAAGYVRKNN